MNPDELDNLIRDALRGEADPIRVEVQESRQRLESFWRHERSLATRRRQRRMGVALAASVALAAGLTAAYFASPDRGDAIAEVAPVLDDGAARQEPEQVVGHEQSPGSPESSSPITPPADAPAHALAQGPPVQGQPPTDYERLMFTLHSRSATARRAAATTANVDAAIARLSAAPAPPAEQVIADLALSAPADRRLVEQTLLKRLARAPGRQVPAVLELLSHIGTRASVGPLLETARRPESLAPALAALQQIVGLGSFAELAHATNDPAVRRAIAGRLLAAAAVPAEGPAEGTTDGLALAAYLGLVQQASTRQDALAALRGASSPPVVELAALLGAPDEQTRRAAAMALASVDDARVGELLVSRLSKSPDSNEAWLALLARRGPLAQSFLNFAEGEPRLLVHLNSARAQWARMVP